MEWKIKQIAGVALIALGAGIAFMPDLIAPVTTFLTSNMMILGLVLAGAGALHLFKM